MRFIWRRLSEHSRTQVFNNHIWRIIVKMVCISVYIPMLVFYTPLYWHCQWPQKTSISHGELLGPSKMWLVLTSMNAICDRCFFTWDSGGCHSPHLEPEIWTPGQFGLKHRRREPRRLEHTSAGQTQKNKYNQRLLVKDHLKPTLEYILHTRQQCSVVQR